MEGTAKVEAANATAGSSTRICARDGCSQPLGPVSWRMYGESADYCSRSCMETVQAEQEQRKHRKRRVTTELPQRQEGGEGTIVEVPATDFGAAGVVRQVCDRPGCGRPLGVQLDGSVALSWKGRDGVYCSNRCKKIAESIKRKEENMTSSDTAAATAVEKPITTAEPHVPKAPAKGKAKIAKIAKSKAPKAKAKDSDRAVRLDPEAKITKRKGWEDARFGGERTPRIAKMVRDGMTVEAFGAACAKAGEYGPSGFLRYLLERDLIALK